MIGPSQPRVDPACRTTASDLLTSIGHLLGECHKASLSLQDAVASVAPPADSRPHDIETWQHLDLLTQIQADLAALLPALAEEIGDLDSSVDHLAGSVRLISLKDRLFNTSRFQVGSPAASGEIVLF